MAGTLTSATVGGKILASLFNPVVAWSNRAGLVAVIPTSVAGTGVTLGSGGTVTATASTAVTINGPFTASFATYLLVYDVVHAATSTMTLQMCLVGTPATTANYDTQVITGTGATVTAGGVAAGTSLQLVSATAVQHSGEIKIYNPFVAAVTRFAGGSSVEWSAAGVPNIGFTGGGHRLATSYDGIQISAASAMTGTFRLYGLGSN
jgi:hypothetical protein